ncbi:MAG: phosphate acyltransferase PlsX [Nitrospinota bacterium]
MKIALDAMGGDHAPSAVVEGAVQACRELGVEVLLAGREEVIGEELRRLDAAELPITVRPATQVVEMNEVPTAAMKRKPDSSMRRAIEAVQEGEADAVVSAGNTGTLLASSMIVLRTIKGIDRPAITALIPNAKGHCVMMDVGANVDCKPQHLFQFGLMGEAYARLMFRRKNPTVGLLNVGTEKSKGNKVTKMAFDMFEQSPLNFVGNIEGTDVFRGVADVIVCDGFAGNVALKITEGVTEVFTESFRRELRGSLRSRLGMLLLQDGLRSLYRRMDYTEYGGAPLLGIDGVCIKAHGASNAKAVKNAVRAAREACEGNLIGRIQEEIAKIEELEAQESVGYRLWKQLRDSIHRHEGSEAD